MPKLTNPFPRTCIKCEGSEIDKPFPEKGNQCKECLTEYNTLYIRNKRGSKPRSRMSPEERRQAQAESKKRSRDKKKASKTRDELMRREIQKLIAEAADYDHCG